MSRRTHRFRDAFVAGEDVLIVFDLDGVVAQWKNILITDRNPETYAALKPNKQVVSAIKALMERRNVVIAYLTARGSNLKQVTDEWLHNLGIGGAPVYRVDTIKDKIKALPMIAMDQCVLEQNTLMFDDRWTELLESRIIRRTHTSATKYMGRSDPRYVRYPYYVSQLLYFHTSYTVVLDNF